MNILIKSFYRPYLLDRCLYSIYQKVNDLDQIEVTVLDDGTPQKYLDKIQEKYPEVNFKFSQYRDEKIEKIENHLNNDIQYYDLRIPSELWYEAIESSSDFLILTEDDVWFVDDFNMTSYIKEMEKFNIHILKLGRILEKDVDIIPTSQLTDEISYHNPNFIIKSKKFYNLLLNNSFNIKTTLERYNLLPKRWKMQLWVMYDIPMAMYRKDYLLFLWKDKYKRVVEYLQLKNAIDWNFKHQGKCKYTLMNKAKMRTSYRSSASFNTFNIQENFDLIKYNFILNELWFNNQFDELENYPNDFSTEYIYNVLKEKEDQCFANNWRKWTERFIEIHKNS